MNVHRCEYFDKVSRCSAVLYREPQFLLMLYVIQVDSVLRGYKLIIKNHLKTYRRKRNWQHCVFLNVDLVSTMQLSNWKSWINLPMETKLRNTLYLVHLTANATTKLNQPNCSHWFYSIVATCFDPHMGPSSGSIIKYVSCYWTVFSMDPYWCYSS
jgi:hypothetical protein